MVKWEYCKITKGGVNNAYYLTGLNDDEVQKEPSQIASINLAIAQLGLLGWEMTGFQILPNYYPLEVYFFKRRIDDSHG